METTYDKDGKYLGKLADVFGDPTRRSVYRHLRDATGPVSATEVAEVFGLHRTVARAHLERLCELGLVESGTRRRAGGGRPAKTYVLTDERLEVMLPPRRYELLSRALLRLIGESMERDAAAAAAFSLGRTFGEETAAEIAGDNVQPPVALAPKAVLAWMDVPATASPWATARPARSCSRSTTACTASSREEFPDIVCRFDLGTVCGMLGVDESAHTQTHQLSRGDGMCRHEFRL